MRTFKLRKTYPGSPEIGYEIKFKPGFPFVNTGDYKFSLDDCIKFTENWLEINRNILSFKTTLGIIWNLADSGMYRVNKSKNDILSLAYALSQPEIFKIYSVKTHNGTILTIGDTVSATDGNRYYSKIGYSKNRAGGWCKEFYSTTINAFKIIDEGILCMFEFR